MTRLKLVRLSTEKSETRYLVSYGSMGRRPALRLLLPSGTGIGRAAQIKIVGVMAFAVFVMITTTFAVTMTAPFRARLGKRIEFRLLVWSQHLADLLAGGGGLFVYFQGDGFVEFPRVFLAGGNDFFNLLVLLGGQRQFAVHAAKQRS